MPWSIDPTTATASALSDAQLAELDAFDLISQTPSALHAHLRAHLAPLLHALLAALAAHTGRQHLLRAVRTLHTALTPAASDRALLSAAVRRLAFLHLASPPPVASPPAPAFLRPLADLAVHRVSDTALSTPAAAALAVLLGCPVLDAHAHPRLPDPVPADATSQTSRLVRLLLTEIVLTSSPAALAALSALLRRDPARRAFAQKDGVSALAAVLPGATAARAYHAAFALWMLSYARGSTQQLVLRKALSARVLLRLAALLASPPVPLKVARVALAALRNFASGKSNLHVRVRRDLIAAHLPATLGRLLRAPPGPGAPLGADADALADAGALHDVLAVELAGMSTLDCYVDEVRSGALHWSPVHRDVGFWQRCAQRVVDEHRDVVERLACIVRKGFDGVPAEVCVACNDLGLLMQESVSGRAVVLRQEGLKTGLMKLMAGHSDGEVRAAALVCVQLMLMSGWRG